MTKHAAYKPLSERFSEQARLELEEGIKSIAVAALFLEESPSRTRLVAIVRDAQKVHGLLSALAATAAEPGDEEQVMRTRGIEDAIARRPACYWLSSSGVLRNGPSGDHSALAIPHTAPEYRNGFAYARAYQANSEEQ